MLRQAQHDNELAVTRTLLHPNNFPHALTLPEIDFCHAFADHQRPCNSQDFP
jgi:hypothetical protein